MTGYTNLYLYKNTKFYKHQNYVIDDINSFLATLQLDKLTFENLQYFRPDSIQKELKIPFNQKGIKSLHQYNYARVVIFNTDQTQEWELFYYVDKIEWVSSDCIRLKMTCDTLNSYLPDLEFHPKTMIEREHIDRWDYNGYKIDSTTISILRAIPELNEGLNPQLYCYVFNFNGERIKSNIVLSRKIYGNIDDFKYKGMPIYHFHYQQTQYYQSSDWYEIVIGDVENGKPRLIFLPNKQSGGGLPFVNPEEGGGVRPTTTCFDIDFSRTQNVNVLKIPYTPSESLRLFYTFTQENPFEDEGNFKGGKYTYPETNTDVVGFKFKYNNSVQLDHINVSNDFPNIARIINFGNNELASVSKASRLYKLLYEKSIVCEDIIYQSLINSIVDNGYFKRMNYSNESALFNSEFYQISFQYDIFEFTISLENLKYIDTLSNFEKLIDEDEEEIFGGIKFIPPILMGNQIIFQFYFGDSFEYDFSKYADGDVLYCSVNNKMPLFNSEYLNYIRNGYNWDIRIRDVGRNERAARIGLTGGIGAIVGGIGGAIAGGVMGTGIGAIPGAIGGALLGGRKAIPSAVGEYFNRMREDLEMDKQLAQLKGNKIGVENCDGGIEKTLSINRINKLCVTINAPRKTWWKYLEDYFYFYGNKVQYYGIPTHNNRCLFDYLKCRAEFVNRNSVPNEESLQDIIARLGNGVTFIHKYLNLYTFDSDYKENVENRLLEIIQGE